MTIAAGPESFWMTESHVDGWWSRLAGWWLRTRGDRVVWLVVMLWGLNALDLACTLHANQHLMFGVFGEANPIAARVLSLGPGAIVAYKLALVALGTGPLLALRRYRLAELSALALTLSYAFVMLHWKTYFEIGEVQELLARAAQGLDAPATFLTCAY